MKSHKAGSSFTPTPEMIQAAQNVFLRMAFLDMVKPIVKAYTEVVLAERDWPIDVRFAHRYQMYLIKQYEDIHLMDTNHWTEFYTRVNQVRLEKGIYVKKDDLCPVSVANTQLFSAQQDLLTAMSGITQLTADQVNQRPPAQRKHVIDLTLKLLAPFINNPLLPNDANLWCIGEVAKSIEDARTLVALATTDLDLRVGHWEKVEDSQCEYTTLDIDDQHCLSIGISSKGVVSVNGDPYTLKSRLLNNKLAYVHDSIERRIKTILPATTTKLEVTCNN